MKTYLLKAGVRQAIAKAGETDIAVAYNAKTWVDEYPAGNPQLMVTTPGGKRVPVTVETVDNLITGQVPNELLAGPGVYSYVFIWTSGSTQLESGRCECLVLGSNLTKDLTHDSRRTPDWAERIFLAAEVIEGAIPGMMEARNTTADNAAEAKTAAEAAAESESAAADSAEAAAASEENIDTILTNMEQTITDATAAMNGIEAQKNTMIASIASVAGQGTDTTLTQSGVAADAKAAGDQISDLKSDYNKLNYFDTHSETAGYTRWQDGTFSPTSGFYDSNLIPCFPNTDFYIVEEKKRASQSLPQTDKAINFFDAEGNWLYGVARYTMTVTEITAQQSKFGYGGWLYKFTIPNNAQIAYWITYFSGDRWNNFGLFCYYETGTGNYKFAGNMPISAIYFDKSIPMDRIDGINALVDDFERKTSIAVKEQSLYADWSEFGTGYLNTSGNPVEYANAYLSDFVKVEAESTVQYNIRVIGDLMLGVAWYDANKNFINGIKHSGDAGSWQTEIGSVELPSNAKYIRYGGRSASGTAEKAQYVTYYTNEEIRDYLTNNTETNPWSGKNWVAFGTSITDTSNSLGEGEKPTGKYVPYLQKMSGMSVINKGIAGASIGVVPNVIAGRIMTAIKSSDNLSAIQNADLVTIEGFVNDFVGNLPIGTIADTDNSTLMGALYEAVTYLYAQNPNVTVVLLTESTGQYIDSSHWFPVTRPNALGKYQYEYNDAIITIGKYLGCHVIDCGQKSQINQWHTEYLEDWIHHSELGGKQYAETIWDELKNIHCNSDVSVS